MSFKPIYIYAQALDNVSNDDIYQIISFEQYSRAEFIDDLPKTQSILKEMGDIANSSDLLQSFVSKLSLSKKHFKNFKDISINFKQKKVFLKFGTDDKDVLGRPSNIDILLDLTDVKEQDIHAYVQYFYTGFIDFTQKTNRTPKDLDLLKEYQHFEQLLKDIGFPNQSITEAIMAKTQQLKDSKFLYIIIFMIVSLIVAIIYAIFNVIHTLQR